MIKPALSFYSAFALLFCFVSCKKGDTSSFQGTYHSGNSYIVESPVIYTASGKITDTALIRQFIDRKSRLGLTYLFLNQSTRLNPYSFELRFIDNNKVEIHDSLAIIPTEITSTLEDELIITSIDSSAYTPFYPPTRTTQLSTDILQIVPNPVCPTSVLSPKCKYRQSFPVLISGNDLSIPYISYYVVSGSFSSYGRPMAWNAFNEKGLANFSTEDTVLIQMQRLQMIKE